MTNPTTPVIDVHLDGAELTEALRTDVHAGLSSSPKELPPKYFYDDRGSLLFDEITRLPEYYPTRREWEIIKREAPAIAAWGAQTLVELGSGTSEKTRTLIRAMWEHGTMTTYVPFDVSEGILRTSSDQIASEYPGLAVHGVVGDFDHHLSLLPGVGRRLVAFLGGTIGNFDPEGRKTLLAGLAEGLRPGDGLLLGADLIKDHDRLVAAYDDAAGVTADFNKNVLRVINRELDADFDVDAFDHVALYNTVDDRIEMWLRTATAQSVSVKGLDLDVSFQAGEQMRTEISCKFSRETIAALLGEAGFTIEQFWTDEAGDFSLTLARLDG